MKKMILRLYKYNEWRYNLMFTSFEKQEDHQEVLLQNTGLFFNDILGTLKHNLAADYIWLGRIMQLQEINVPLNSENKLAKFDLKELIQLWKSDDEKIFNKLEFNYDQVKLLLFDVNQKFQQIIEASDDQWLSEECEYYDSKGVNQKKERMTALFHLINHHTHHIGQISTIYTQKYGRKDYFSIDFIYFK